mmetsp:Transcript_497/g.1020  ORF Transcript_497/g.1020 Transcript_497/m.1020 type:complete len:86 (+) Transcript_497:577-834(+)
MILLRNGGWQQQASDGTGLGIILSRQQLRLCHVSASKDVRKVQVPVAVVAVRPTDPNAEVVSAASPNVRSAETAPGIRSPMPPNG